MGETKHYQFFCNKECEYFPCHKGIDEENFNCLFCYCPLYALGDRCGGNMRWTEKGVKDCTNCTFPHQKENYDKIIKRYSEILEVAQSNRKINDTECNPENA